MKKAVLVGSNYQRTPSIRLYGCVNDVVNTSQMLITKYGYLPNNVVILRDDTNDRRFWPTRANILGNLQNLVKDSDKCSEIWFQYSGHGLQVMSKTRVDEDIDEAILPLDYRVAGFITDNDIYDIIKQAKCRVMLIFDCCHSGTVCDLHWCYEYENSSFTRSIGNKKTITSNPNIICLSGCKDTQSAADGYSSSKQESMGVFTDAFITCLDKLNYKTNIMTLYSEIVDSIQKSGFSQVPVLSCSSVIPSFNFTPVKPVLTMISSIMPSARDAIRGRVIMGDNYYSRNPRSQTSTVLENNGNKRTMSMKFL